MAAFTNTISNLNQMLNSILWGRGMLLCFLLVGFLFTVGTRFFSGPLVIQMDAPDGRQPLRQEGRQAEATCPFHHSVPSTLHRTRRRNRHRQHRRCCYRPFYRRPGRDLLDVGFRFSRHDDKLCGKNARHPLPLSGCKNRWVGGAMVYMEKGLHCKWMALLFAALCIPVSFGMGNLSQSNSMAQAMENAFGVSPKVTGAAAAILIGIILLGGIKRIAAVTEKLVPIMAILYLTAGCAVILMNIRRLPQAVGGIISEAFSIRSAIGGTAGYGMARALRTGVSMGVFSNEAGLGTSVIVHCDADVKEPVEQGMWGIFEVFADTLVCCTVTALAILTSGVWAPSCAYSGTALCAAAFATVFGAAGEKFIAISIVLFAFATLIGWSYYGERAVSYLLGDRAVPLYKILFAAVVLLGSTVRMELAWSLSDTFNALLAIPNLIAITILSREVFQLTKDYVHRYFLTQKTANSQRIKAAVPGHNRCRRG